MPKEIDLNELVEQARAKTPLGQVATYIPALAHAKPNWVAASLNPGQGVPQIAGDSTKQFSMQSISKIFALLYALEACGQAQVFKYIGYEPSGLPFYSLVQLEYEQGHPRNPLINAGAIAISALFPGQTVGEKIRGYQHFLTQITGVEYLVNNTTYLSESETGYRNRAVANLMRNFGVINIEPHIAVETYFQQCSVMVDVGQLADLGLILAQGGCHPTTGFTVAPEHVAIVNALMASCGLYDESGLFAVKVGIPAKSGVSGGLLAIAPRRYAIATFGPALNEKGNSLAGLHIMTEISQQLGLSLYL